MLKHFKKFGMDVPPKEKETIAKAGVYKAVQECTNIPIEVKAEAARKAAEEEKEVARKKSNYRNKLINNARRGDETAIESLTLDDMDLYTTLSKKIRKQDIYSLVDTYFMPYGVECDQYSDLGEVVDSQKVINHFTDEAVYIMRIACNEIEFDVCINEADLLGEPAVGRRFKGNIWMQGMINYPE